jgi:hypothetical protein
MRDCCGQERPSWVETGKGVGGHCSVGRLLLGRARILGTHQCCTLRGGSRGSMERQRRGPSSGQWPGRWAPCCWLHRVARASKLVGYALTGRLLWEVRGWRYRGFRFMNHIYIWEGIIGLEGFLGFEPRVAESQLLNARLCTGTLVRPLCLQGNAGRAPSLNKIIPRHSPYN